MLLAVTIIAAKFAEETCCN